MYQSPTLGNGMVIGFNGVLHVLVSHGVAIGMIALLVLLDSRAPRPTTDEWRVFLRRLLRVSVVLTTVGGAVTGAGIWFTTATLAPRAIGSMLRVFFWPWFVEWLVFVAEVVVLLVLYFRWDGLTRRRRTALGLAYLALVLASAFLISGILGFMLTPGDWPGLRGLGSAFFNPSFAPQLLTRLALGMVLGAIGVVTLLAIRPVREPVFGAVSRTLGWTLVVATPLLAAFLAWYLAVAPVPYRERTAFSILTSHLSQTPWLVPLANLAAAGLLAATAWCALHRRRKALRWLAVPALVAAAGVATELERVREFIRGPYLMPGYMYVSGVLVSEVAPVARLGVRRSAVWAGHPVHDAGPRHRAAFVFASSCSGCHTLDGINAISDRLRGRSVDGIAVILDHTWEMVPFMPPLAASRDEGRLTARYLHELTTGELEMRSRARHVPAAP